jgi:hypothetical protein
MSQFTEPAEEAASASTRGGAGNNAPGGPHGPSFQWDELTKWAAAVPVAASAFAFAFDIGYFYSIDIGWFSFFSLSEHVAFALRTLPIALAATVVLAMVMNPAGITNGPRRKWRRLISDGGSAAKTTRLFATRALKAFWALALVVVAVAEVPIVSASAPESRFLWVTWLAWYVTWIGAGFLFMLSCYMLPYRQSFVTLWIATLLVSITYVIWVGGYIVLPISIGALGAGTVVYFSSRRSRPVWLTFAYSIMVLATFTFLLGFVSGETSYLEALRSYKRSVVNLTKGDPIEAHILHPGQAGVLVYQYRGQTSGGGILFLRWNQIKDIVSCSDDRHYRPKTGQTQPDRC